ncbi:MAG: hypothetical protein FJW37_09855, partial [Acidobacteria bacterium]|nr:hypothetical protein [Acidobacteriota bacterium]
MNILGARMTVFRLWPGFLFSLALAAQTQALHPGADHLPVEVQAPCSAAPGEPAAFSVPLTREQEARALALYRRSLVITAHDHCAHPGDFREMEAAGITARTIKPIADGVYWVGMQRFRIEEPVNGWFARGQRALDLLDRRVEEGRGKIITVRKAEDIRRAKREKKLAVVYSFEGARPLEGRIDTLKAFYDRGLRELQLYWAVPSPLKNSDGTLSEFGLSVIREMNRLGMLIDLSHMSDAAFGQALRTTAQPVVVSHCGVAAAAGVPARGTDQLSDETIRQIAANGGAICLHFYEGYIRPRHGQHATVVDLVDHMDHIRKLVGIDSIALGVDWFPEKGWRWIQGGETMAGMPNVVREMVRRGYSDEEIE